MVSRDYKTVVALRLEDRDNQWTRPLGGGYGTGHTDANRHLEARPVCSVRPFVNSLDPTYECGFLIQVYTSIPAVLHTVSCRWCEAPLKQRGVKAAVCDLWCVNEGTALPGGGSHPGDGHGAPHV